MTTFIWYKQGLTELPTDPNTKYSCNTSVPVEASCFNSLFSKKSIGMGTLCFREWLWLQLLDKESIHLSTSSSAVASRQGCGTFHCNQNGQFWCRRSKALEFGRLWWCTSPVLSKKCYQRWNKNASSTTTFKYQHLLRWVLLHPLAMHDPLPVLIQWLTFDFTHRVTVLLHSASANLITMWHFD